MDFTEKSTNYLWIVNKLFFYSFHGKDTDLYQPNYVVFVGEQELSASPL